MQQATAAIVNKSALPSAEEQEHRRSQPADETATASTSGQDEKGPAGEGKEQQKPEEQLADHELHQIGTFAQVGCAICLLRRSAVPSAAVLVLAQLDRFRFAHAVNKPYFRWLLVHLVSLHPLDDELAPQEGRWDQAAGSHPLLSAHHAPQSCRLPPNMLQTIAICPQHCPCRWSSWHRMPAALSCS